MPGAEGLGEGYIEEINVSVNNRFLFQKANYSQLPKSAFSLSDGRTGTIRKVQSDPIKEMNEYMKKCLSIHKLFFLWATQFGKKTVNTE